MPPVHKRLHIHLDTTAKPVGQMRSEPGFWTKYCFLEFFDAVEKKRYNTARQRRKLALGDERQGSYLFLIDESTPS
jgi:hypothetical protein